MRMLKNFFRIFVHQKFFPCTRRTAAWDHFVCDVHFLLASEVVWNVRVDVWCGENRTVPYEKIDGVSFPLCQNTKEIL